MTLHVIYDGNCNLCVTLVQVLETFDQGKQFQYVPMQDQTSLTRWGITSQDCELGMILLDSTQPERRWQGTAAAEEIGRLLPLGNPFVEAYRLLPGLKWTGDRLYEYIRDHRYMLFGQRPNTYRSQFFQSAPLKCNCNESQELDRNAVDCNTANL